MPEFQKGVVRQFAECLAVHVVELLGDAKQDVVGNIGGRLLYPVISPLALVRSTAVEHEFLVGPSPGGEAEHDGSRWDVGVLNDVIDRKAGHVRTPGSKSVPPRCL